MNLILFARKPMLGAVKTRLAASIGDAKALEVYEQLLHRTIKLCINIEVKRFVFWSDDIHPEKDKIGGFVAKEQFGEDLGDRMKNAFEFCMKENPGPCVLIGSDCFDLKLKDVQNAFDQLSNHDVVIGPAVDGGYYLIGMQKLHKSLFCQVDWGGVRVFSQTLRKIESEDLKVKLLPKRRDLDDHSDYLEYLKHGS